jgi:hypothetical protein
VLLHRRDRLFIELKLHKLLRSAFDGDATLVLSPSQREALKPFLVMVAERQFRQTPLLDSWALLCQALASSEVEAAFTLVRHVLILEELEDAPEEYKGSLYRSGLSVKDWLFDCLNLLCGYHDFNDKAIEEFPHVAIVFEHIQGLLNTPTAEERAWNFVDSLCVKLYVRSN